MTIVIGWTALAISEALSRGSADQQCRQKKGLPLRHDRSRRPDPVEERGSDDPADHGESRHDQPQAPIPCVSLIASHGNSTVVAVRDFIGGECRQPRASTAHPPSTRKADDRGRNKAASPGCCALPRLQQGGIAVTKPIIPPSGPPRDNGGRLSSSQPWSVAPAVNHCPARRLLAPVVGPIPAQSRDGTQGLAPLAYFPPRELVCRVRLVSAKAHLVV